MKQEEDFDEIIRQKFAEKEFVFNEENWEKAERKIDAARRFKKILLWSTVFITGFFCGIGVTFVFIQKKQMNDSIVLNGFSPKNHLNVTIENNVNRDKNNTSNDAYTANNINEPNETGNDKEKDGFINDKNYNTSILAQHQSHNGITMEGKRLNMQNEQNRVTGEQNNKNEYKNKTGISGLIGQKSEKTDKESKRREKVETAETNKLNEKWDKYEETISKAESDQSLQVRTSKVESSSNIEKTDSAIHDFNSIVNTQKDVITHIFKDAEAAAVMKDSSSLKSDSVLAADQNNLKGTSVLPGGLSSATFISLVIGTNVELGWQYGEASEGRGFNPIAGVEINHYVNHKWMVSSGIQYGSIAYLKASEKQFSKTTYGFGSVSVDTIINTTLLHYAVVPVLLEYNLNDKNAISIGGSVSYLVNTNSKVSTRSTAIGPMSGNTGEVKTISDMESGYYTNAFNKWDASLSIGYRRRITQRLTASVLANCGLLDIKNNAFFSREKFERNSGIKLVISYTLFDL